MRFFWVTLALITFVGVGARAHNYISAERCESCHEFAYQKWQRGPHASAAQSLSPAQARDPKCTTCHSLTSMAEVDDAFVGVQCESCHGPGRYYYPDYVMRDSQLARAVGLVEQNEAVCVRCHTPGSPSIEAFDFERMWAAIDHGKAAREAWEARGRGKEENSTERDDKENAGQKTASR